MKHILLVLVLLFSETGWNAKLREAVTNLEQAVLSYKMSYKKGEGAQRWRPQGDLNPCRRRERAVS